MIGYMNNFNDLVRFGVMTNDMKDFLIKSINRKKNILFVGGGSSEEIALLKASVNHIHPEHSIVIVERPLNINKDRYKDNKCKSIIDNSKCIIDNIDKSYLDRTIIGECRWPEELHFFVHVGEMHGSNYLATLTADNPKEALYKLSMLYYQLNKTNINKINTIIAESVNIIVQVEKIEDNSIKVLSIGEVIGFGGIEIIEEMNRHIYKNMIDPKLIIEENTDALTKTFHIRDMFKHEKETNKFINTGWMPMFK
ncbi:ATPase, T2SS/T4P/T4SS family [Alkaliphilus sp. B6464]|uniref:ATPase, T2SS/T4P/T4SS family n=1 Tax=Alkaliphilus sp. B6464 TaxID=2731219 RepID=UPI001BA97EAD|nr:ATPase, T2SS/T4P/T4SS family [Alkaliphilus sp. B6464]QUH21915.1 Flp pilus assembly complex ATPase component TadA [Alkaliphilus sp. B6464]